MLGNFRAWYCLLSLSITTTIARIGTITIWLTVWNDSTLVVDALAGKKKGGGGFGKKTLGLSSFSSLEELLSTFPTRQPSSTTEVPCPCGTRKKQVGGSLPQPLSYHECCQPLHDHTQPCTSPLDLLRSRYTAFCYRNIRHIMATTHESNRDWQADTMAWAQELNRDGMFDSFEFVELKLLDSSSSGGQEWQPQQQGETTTNDDDDGNSSWIEFQVTLRGRGDDYVDDGPGDQRNRKKGFGNPSTTKKNAKVAGLETIVKERSRFLRNPETGVWTYAGGDVTSQSAGLEDSRLNP